MNSDKSDLRIGELLIEAQILRPRDLADAIKVAKFTSLPIGRVLVMSSYVREKEFQAAVKVQSLVRDQLIPLNSGIDALSLMYRNDSLLEEALNDIGWAAATDAKTNKLGEILIETQIITIEQFDKAMETSHATSLPLGRVLVSLGFLTDETLTTALNCQVLIRDNKLTREQGLSGLKAAHQRRLPLEITLIEKGFFRGPAKPTIRLGELLVLSGLVNSTEIMTALEIALAREQPLGRVLIDLGQITPHILDAALTLQEMCANKTLDHGEAAQCLFKVHQNEILDDALVSLEVPEAEFKITVRYHDILRVASVIQHSDIELTDIDRSAKPSSVDAVKSAKQLLQNGFIDERTYFGSLRAYFLMARGWLNIQQGIIALNYFKNKPQFKFDEILYELDWAVRTKTTLPSDNKQPTTETV